MKQLLFLAIILLMACSKPTILTETKTLYYRIQQVDKDGKTYTSVTRYVRVDDTLVARDGEEGDDDDDDDEDEDEDDDDHCDTTVLPIKIGTFAVSKIDNSRIRVSWEAENEQEVDHYIIERSTDLKNWVVRLNYIPDLSGKYTITDTYE